MDGLFFRFTLFRVRVGFFFRDYYSRESDDFLSLVTLVFAVVYLMLRFIFDKKKFIGEVKPGVNNLIKRWPEISVIVLMFVLWCFYKRNGN